MTTVLRTITITEADVTRWRDERRAAEPHTFHDGPHEDTGQDYRTWEPRYSVLQVILGIGKPRWIAVTRCRWGHKRYETWFDAIGQKTGRWWWVPEPRHRPAGSPPLPQTCARDALEDEMGYEAATAFIGSREASFGYPCPREPILR